MDNYQKTKNKIASIAQSIKDMEDACDWSMRGVYLDQVVGKYVELKAPIIIDIFENILKYQKDKEDSYGDIDTSIIKLNIKGEMHEWKHYKEYDFSTSGVYIRDNPTCSSYNQWVMVKVIQKHKPMEGVGQKELDDFLTIEEIHIRLVNKETKEINLHKLFPYGDSRDEGYVASFEKKFGQKFKLKDGRGMLYYYPKLEQLMHNLYSVDYKLKEKM